MAQTINLPPPRIKKVRVVDAVSLYEQDLRSKGRAESTIKNAMSNLGRFAEDCGPGMHMHEIEAQDFAKYMLRFVNRDQGTKNKGIERVNDFFRWARVNKYMSPYEYDIPSQGWQSKSYEPRMPEYVPAQRWGELHAIAEQKHISWRAAIATGLYLMQRGPSEWRILRYKDLNLHKWEVGIIRPKTRSQVDWIPVAAELQLELARWLTFYNNYTIKTLGTPLQPEWPLWPSLQYDRRGPDLWGINPSVTRSGSSIQDTCHMMFTKFGFKTLNDDGTRNRMFGSHALRKIGLRALFDSLVDEGYDGAIQICQAMAGHKSPQTTERYLGLSVDRVRRNKAVRRHGGFMFDFNNPANARLQATQLLGKELPGLSPVPLPADALEEVKHLTGALLKVA